LKNSRLFSVTLALLVTPASTTVAQSLPPVRQLGRIVTKSPLTVPSIASTRELSGGRVLINDTVARRLYLFDSALRSRVVVLDSSERAKNAYGYSPGGMIAFRGDSTLFASPALATMLQMKPHGSPTR
jgi:hypothetical protein